MIPQSKYADLSETAKKVYRKTCGEYSKSLSVSHDDTDTLTACREIAAAGRGKFYEPTGTESYEKGHLRVVQVAKELSVARSGSTYNNLSYVEVGVHHNMNPSNDDEAVLLACLHGAEVYRKDTNSRMLPAWRIIVRHDSATDFEHDRSTLADLTIINPVFTEVNGTRTVLVGTLGDMDAYPADVDFLTVDDADSGTPEMCADSHCDRDPHMIARYSPPERDSLKRLLGRAVKVTITSLSMVDSEGRPLTED